jgi:hypothetical protein
MIKRVVWFCLALSMALLAGCASVSPPDNATFDDGGGLHEQFRRSDGPQPSRGF